MREQQMKPAGCVLAVACVVLFFWHQPAQASNESQKVQRPSVRTRVVHSVTLLSPNGAEEWSVGSAQEIAWSYSGPPTDQLSLSLYEDDRHVGHIIDVAAGTGAYGWLVGHHEGGKVSPGRYRVKAEIVGTTVHDFSDRAFAITASNRMTSRPVMEVPDVLINRSCPSFDFAELMICASGECHEFRSSCFPYRCIQEEGRCAESCTDDLACAAPARCKNSRCVVPAWRCLDSGPNRYQLFDGIDTYVDCSPFRCSNGPFCPGYCDSTGDCQYPLVCNSVGRCVPRPSG